ncbi:hypothetical protein PAXINDRAFT_168653 [Paxillus involutus ATCC 200175]|nr:hypothetical protein PAXINDRAFT_168653 [Paxillus involutus ATCC 200175]
MLQFSLLKELLALSALASLARADYFIDDQNFTSLLYSENPGGAKWGPFQEGGETLSISLANGTLMTIDASQCYNYTYTYAACTVADDCQVQIPFTGSGITVYVLQAGAQGINASITIDGGSPKYNVLSAPPGPGFYIPNVTLFNLQGITTGNHVATMTVQNWDNIFSGMMFDYAAINETLVSSTTTSSSIPSSTVASTTSPTSTAPASQNSSHVSIGAIVGGVIGGLLALVAIVLAIVFFRRRRRGNRGDADLDSEPKIEPFLPPDAEQQRERYSNTAASQSASSPTAFPRSRSQEPLMGSASPPLLRKSQMGLMNPNTSAIPEGGLSTPSHRTPSSNATSADSSEPPRPRIQQTHPMLTDDQADFVNSLYTNNVPAAAIARVIERMMAGERRPAVEGYASGYLQPERDHIRDSAPPPSYDHVTGGD